MAVVLVLASDQLLAGKESPANVPGLASNSRLPTERVLRYLDAVHRASWQTITWVLVAAILGYVLLGPNLISWGLAIVGVLGAVIKAAEERWVTWQLGRRRQVSRGP